MPQKNDRDTLMVTVDFTNLYNNISHKLGIQAIFWIKKYPETQHPRFSKIYTTDGIELILNNNSFQFNNVIYIQTRGKAMGTKIAPTYTTLTLAYLEKNLFGIIDKKKKIQQQYKDNLLDHGKVT